MISANYISTGKEDFVYNDYLYTCEKYLDDTLNEFNTEYINYRTTVETALLESSILSIVPDDGTMMIVEEANKNIVQKFGDALIKMGRKFIEFIETKIREMKDHFFKFKSNEKKLADLIKKHPELGKEKIQNLCADGVLDLSDMKSLAELDNEFEKILKAAKMGENPDSLDSKWEKAKKKCLGKNYADNGHLSNTEKVVGLAAATISLALAIKTFGPKIAEANKKAVEMKAEEQRKMHEYAEMLKDEDSFNSAGYNQRLLAMKRELLGLHMMAIGKQKTVVSRIQDLYAKTLDKFEGVDKGKAKWDNMAANNKAVADRLDKEEYKKEYNTQKAKNAANKPYEIEKEERQHRYEEEKEERKRMYEEEKEARRKLEREAKREKQKRYEEEKEAKRKLEIEAEREKQKRKRNRR